MVFRGLRSTAYRSVGVLFVLTGLGWCETAPDVSSAPVEVAVSTVPAPEPFVAPLGVKTLKILSAFGKRTLPPNLLAATTSQAELKFYEKPHEGVDYAGVAGMPVLAAKSGKVLFAGFSRAYVSRKNPKDQQRLIILMHPDGQSTRYVHLSSIKVKPSTEVQAGQLIGTLADSDEWTQPVLHFEIRDKRGIAQDPETMISK